MNKRKTFKILLLIVVILSIYKIADVYVTDKVDSYLKQEQLTYSALSINLLLGNITLKNVSIAKDSLHFKTEKLEITGVSYYHYLKNKAIHIAGLKTNNSIISGKITKKEDTKKTEEDKSKQKPLVLKIENIAFRNLKVDLKNRDDFPLKAKKIDLEINNFELDKDKYKTIPFLYSNIEASIINFETQYSKVQNVKFSKLVFKKDNLSLDSLEIVPLKPRENYIYYVSKEKELLTLFSKKVVFSDIKIEDNKRLNVVVNDVLFDEVFFNLYLDGTVLEHSTKRKDLYSKSLRDLLFNIDIKNLEIKKSKLIYEEYTVKGNKPGILIFDNLNAQISNINNNSAKKNKLTVAKIHSSFMKSSPLDINWTFDINNKNDDFRIKGSLLDVTSKNMSSFLLPTMNAKMDGYINAMYFDFEGNDITSNGKLNLDFKNFNIKILDKTKSRKNVLSWLANLLIRDSSKNGMVKVKTENVERDQTKSFWNFFWVNIEKGLQNSLI